MKTNNIFSKLRYIVATGMFIASTNAVAGGYLDLGLGILSQSLESENSVVSNSNSSMSPDIDLTVGFSLGGLFIGAKYFSYKESKSQKQYFELYDVSSEQSGTTKGIGYTAGLVRQGLSILYTRIDGASQLATITSERNSDFDPSINARGQSNIELSDGQGYMIDFFYGYQVSPNVFFGPKLAYTNISYKKYKVDEEEVTDFVNLSQSKFTPKLGVVAFL
jgi:hypothetical protein